MTFDFKKEEEPKPEKKWLNEQETLELENKIKKVLDEE